MTQWREYHGASSAEHQARFEELSSQGFRMTSLSVYGDPMSPRYAAVWVQRQGPAYVAFHGKTAAEYQAYFDEQRARGFQPILVSATGGGPLPAVFAGVFEDRRTSFRAAHGISGQELRSISESERNAGLVLRWLSAYGDPLHPIYAAIWSENPTGAGWSLELEDDGQTHQSKLDAYAAGRMWPACVSIAGGRLSEALPGLGAVRYSSVWRDDQIGEWQAVHGLHADAYQHKLDELRALGYMPVAVQAGGDFRAPRFAAIFARGEAPRQRVWSVRGEPSQALSAPVRAALDSFDQVTRAFMEQNHIRAGQLAMVRRGRLVVARAFTNAEAGFPITQPTMVFRAASVSKTLTAMAALSLIEQGQLTLFRKMQSILGLQMPSGGAPSAEIDKIAVWHLLSHCAALDDDNRGEREVVRAFGSSLPATRHQLARYAVSRPLVASLGQDVSYNGIGFFLLGQIVAAQAGSSYEEYIQKKILSPMGISRVAVARALLQDALPNEVWYQPAVPGVDRSVMSPAEPWVPRQYGGWDTALGAAMGGWAFAAADYARLWASFDLGVHSPVMRPETAKIMWTNPWGYDGGTSQKSQVLRGWWRHRWQDAGGVPVTAIGHNGSFAGTAAVTWRRSDGISVVALFNRDVSLDFMGWSPFGSAMNAAIDQVHDHWPSHDLFPSVGLSSMCDDGWRRCQRCQTLHRLGGKAIDACPAGPPGHLDGGQATYTLVHNLPAARGHFGFRRCTKCQSLVHSTGSTAGRCAAGPGAQHDPAVGEYVLAKNEPATSPGQRGWRLCSRCQCVWYSDGSSRGVCPSSGAVGHTGQNGDDYLLLMY